MFGNQWYRWMKTSWNCRQSCFGLAGVSVYETPNEKVYFENNWAKHICCLDLKCKQYFFHSSRVLCCETKVLCFDSKSIAEWYRDSSLMNGTYKKTLTKQRIVEHQSKHPLTYKLKKMKRINMFIAPSNAKRFITL